jgi:3-deoxy-D-manno-octulosonic-acid transferase
VVYFPLDFTWACRRAVARIRPDLVALAELELWPNFIAAVHGAGVSLAVLNGRMSDRSFRGYSRIAFLVRGWLGRISIVAAQTEEYADRFRRLGVPPERLVVTGSVKFDGLETRRDNPRSIALREAFGLRPDEVVFIAGSTQSPEEELALATYESLASRFSALRLILVPRHRERFEEAAALVVSRGHTLLRRSSGGAPQGDRPVILLDTLGELSDCWGLADIAFVGGSLTNRGGQNMIEPAAYGAAVLFGPNTNNFRHARDLLLSVGGAEVVHSGEELTLAVSRLIQDPEARGQMGERARDVMASQQGATGRTVQLLQELLRATASPNRRAA